MGTSCLSAQQLLELNGAPGLHRRCSAPRRTCSGGDAALQTNFESDNPSSWFAELYKEDGLRGGHVIMLGADDASKQAACAALGAYPGGLQLGGGVTTDNAAEYVEAGASHVIVTSYVFRDGRLEAGRLADLVRRAERRGAGPCSSEQRDDAMCAHLARAATALPPVRR